MAESDKQSIPLPFAGGLGQSAGEKRVELPKMAKVDDVRLDRQGVLRKRDGLETLGATGLGTGTVSTIVESRGQTGVIVTDGLFAHSDGDGTNHWTKRNTSSIYPIEVITRRMASTGGLPTNVDVAFLSSGLGCVVWEETDAGQAYSMFVTQSGEIISGPTSMGTHIEFAPRIVTVNSKFMVFAYTADPRSGTAGIYSVEYDGSLGWNTPVSLGFTTQHFDVHAVETETVAYFVTTNITRSLSSDGSTVNNAGLSNASQPYVYHDPTAERVIVAYNNSSSGDWEVVFRSEDLATTHSTTTLIASASKPTWWSNSRGFVAPHGAANYAAAVSAGYDAGVSFVEFNSGGTPQNTRELYGVALHSRGLWDAQTGLVFAVHTWIQVSTNSFPSADAQYPAAYLVRDTDKQDGTDGLEILSRLMSNPSADNNFDWLGHMTSLVDAGSGVMLQAATRTVRESIDTNNLTQEIDKISRVDLNVIDTRAVGLSSAGAAGGSVLVAGGHVGIFDRAQAVENSIHGAPEIAYLDADTATGTLESDGSGSTGSAQLLMDVTVVARWVDSLGRIHRSPPSAVAVWTDTTGRTDDQYWAVVDDITVHVYPPPSAVNGDNQMDLQFELYVWSYNDHGGAATVASTGGRTAYGGQRYLAYVAKGPFTRLTADTNLYEISTGSLNVSQNNIVGAPPEYVQAGELSSDPTEPARDVAASPTRGFFLSADGTYVGASKPFGELHATEFNDAIRIQIPDGDGQAIEVQDDQLVVLSTESVFVTSVAGGPDANGAGADFPPLRRVPSGGGCVDRRSVVSTPAGVLFQSRRGIYLLDRGSNVSFVGADVQDETDGATILASAVVPAQGEALFLLSGGVALAFNYEKGEWFRRTDLPEATLGVSNGLIHYAHTDFEVYRQLVDTYTDAYSANTYVMTVLETPWIRLTGPQGWQRLHDIWLLGQFFGGQFKVEIAYDYSSTYDETLTFTETTMSNEDGQIRIRPARQKCESFKLLITEQENSTTNVGGWWLEEIQLVVSQKNRSYSYKGTTTPV